jgi:hypothetical protein
MKTQTTETPEVESNGRLARVVNRSFDLVENVLDNVDTLVTTARKDSLSVAREFVGIQVSAAERIIQMGDAALTDFRTSRKEEHAAEAALVEAGPPSEA